MKKAWRCVTLKDDEKDIEISAFSKQRNVRHVHPQMCLYSKISVNPPVNLFPKRRTSKAACVAQLSESSSLLRLSTLS